MCIAIPHFTWWHEGVPNRLHTPKYCCGLPPSFPFYFCRLFEIRLERLEKCIMFLICIFYHGRNLNLKPIIQPCCVAKKKTKKSVHLFYYGLYSSISNTTCYIFLVLEFFFLIRSHKVNIFIWLFVISSLTGVFFSPKVTSSVTYFEREKNVFWWVWA